VDGYQKIETIKKKLQKKSMLWGKEKTAEKTRDTSHAGGRKEGERERDGRRLREKRHENKSIKRREESPREEKEDASVGEVERRRREKGKRR